MKLSNYPIIQLSNYKPGVKKFISLFRYFVISLFCCLVVWLPCYAQEASPTAETAVEEVEEATPSPKKDQLEKIRELKEKVAEKVAEERKKKRKAYSGSIKELSESTILLTTKKGEVTIKIDELTKIFRIKAGERETETLEDLSGNQTITALGIAEKEGELTPKIIIAKQKPVIINGKVTEINTKEGTLTVKTAKGEEFVVDYEKTTKCKVFEKGKGLTNSGFSKIEVDDRVHLVGTENEKEESRLTALRLLILPGKALGIVGKEGPTSEPIASPSPAETE